MIQQLLARLGLGDGSLNGQADTRRRHIRYPGVQAEVLLDGHTYGVRDWSLGGVFIEAQNTPAPVAAGEQVHIDMRFRLPHETVIIRQAVRVVRAAVNGDAVKGDTGIAAEFMPLSAEQRRRYDRVIDGLHTQSFLESQAG